MRLLSLFGTCSAFLLACADTGVPDQAGAGQAGASSGSGGGAGISSGGVSTGGGTSGTSGTAGQATGGGSSGSAGAGRAGSEGSAGGAGQSAGGRGGGSGSGGAGGARAGSGGTVAESGTAGEGGASDPGTLDAFELVVIGSSTAAGEGASSDDRGWVSLLGAALEEASSAEITTVNLAAGGYTTTELASGSNANGNIDDAVDREPELIVVSLAGSNDLSAGTNESEFLSRLGELRDRANQAQIPVFFLSTAPKDLSTGEREALRDWADAMADDFGSCWVPDVTGNYAPCFVDIFGPLANEDLGIDERYGAGDGIHLNDAGHEVIFDVTLPVVSAYMCSLVACP